MAKSQNTGQQRQTNSYGRRSPSREEQKRILIVCEGETEEIYFNCLSQEYHLQTVLVIKSAQGGGSGKVVELAIKERRQLKREVRGYDDKQDQTWCVFDTEDLANKAIFSEATQKAKSEKLKLAISNPCIEYWFLLHYEKSTPSLANSDEASKKLRANCVSSYEKNQEFLRTFFPKEILPRTDDAIQNAQACLKKMQETNSEEFPNPCTTVYELVEELNKLKENKPY